MNAPVIPPAVAAAPQRRYEPLLKIASGGTASVWVGASTGAHGFRQLVAIKRPHEHLADDPAFVAALIEEAKLASRLRHANAVDVRDVESDASGVQLVMDWVEGASLSDLIRAWSKEPPARSHAVAIRIALDACEGLRALHELAADDGSPLGCVHRDVSPANILVGLDGVGRITDFGLARPLLTMERTTSQGALRGKLGYMAPEYIRGKEIDHRVDVFAMGIVLWEALAKKRLYRGDNDAETLDRVQREDAPRLVDVAPSIDRTLAAELDALLVRALAKDPADRIGSMADLSSALEKIAREHDVLASHGEVRESFGATLRASLDDRRREVQRALAVANGGPVSGSVSVSVTGPPPPPQAPISIAPPAKEEEGTRPQTPHALRANNKKPSSLFMVVVGVLIAAAFAATAIVIVIARGRDSSVLADRGSPRVIEPDVIPRGDESRPRVAAISASALPAAKGATTRSGGRASLATQPGAGTTASPAAADDKPPRPNPYASGSAAKHP